MASWKTDFLGGLDEGLMRMGIGHGGSIHYRTLTQGDAKVCKLLIKSIKYVNYGQSGVICSAPLLPPQQDGVKAV
jgi:hypothetical protein